MSISLSRRKILRSRLVWRILSIHKEKISEICLKEFSMNKRISDSALVIIGALCVFMIGFKPDALEFVAGDATVPVTDGSVELVAPEAMALINAYLIKYCIHSQVASCIKLA